MDRPEGNRQGRRLDEVLVGRGLFASRSRARDAILRGAVRVDGAVAAKPGQPVGQDAAIVIDDPASAYVSRAALKLIHGLDAFGFDPAGRAALDIGASTGGFTQVLLERGAAHVVAVDVGHGQMAAALAADPRVTSLEGVNARSLDATALGGRTPDMVVCDVSFISIRLALPPALVLAAAGALAVILVKPQFEVGRDAVGKGGIVDPKLAEETATSFREWLDAQPGWRSVGLVESPVLGGDGNREFLLGGVKDR
jgi:23S rRNA (cytidine1920-2'-O)/16S rRNA (cytidine1409-2'-O)-methyltransferase